LQGINARAINSRLEIFSNGTSSGADDSTASGLILLEGAEALLDDLGLTAGTYYPPALAIAQHTSVPEWKTADTFSRPTGSIWVKTTEPNAGARWRVKQWNDSAQLWEDVSAPLYNNNVNTFKVYRRSSAAPTNIVGTRIDANGVSAGSYEIVISATDAGSASYGTATSVAFTTTGIAADASVIASAINNAAIENVSASVDSQNRITISHSQGGDIKITDSLTPVLSGMGFAVGTTTNLRYQDGTDNTTDPLQVQATLWSVLTYTPSDNEVTDLAADDTLWYNSIVDEVDLLVHDGSTWVGFNNATDYASSEITVSASEPTSPSNNDIWISTADLENYPTIYRYNTALQQWDLLDKTDQTTENGVLFADARWTTEADNDQADASEIEDLLLDDFLDPDAPDPALYPRGMLLWNTRRSGFNVKKFVRNYIDLNADNERYNNGEAMSSYYPHRWVTESANQTDGSGSFGRIAQRKVVVQALQAMVNSNDAIRDNESRIFNLMACPGYPELIGEMISLNYDRGLTSFIVGDTPARLPSDATSLNNWATNQLLAVEDNDNGLVSRDEYLGIFYPHGFTSDNFGNNVVVPPSHMMLRTIALSDQVSFPWFAPAGTRRGGITNATATGYIDSEGEFVSIALNEGQRDTLYSNDVNPITFITGAGLVNYGQKTRSRGSSALDRINVARLVIFLRSQLNQLAKPYIFEPNDKITRDEIKQAAESLMLELVGQRALYDFLVVCDESNNTPSRIDRNELYLDIAIEPVKAVEFIYIPLRLKNTGEIAGL